MRVLYVSPEAYPLIKTGGLADVAGALPSALTELGNDVRLLLPAYRSVFPAVDNLHVIASLGDPFHVGEVQILEGTVSGYSHPVWLVDCPSLFNRMGDPYHDEHGNGWHDNGMRFAVLSWAAACLSVKGSPVEWAPDILHLNDWQAALAPAYLHAWGQPHAKTITSIHNMAYQGNFPPDILQSIGLPYHMYQINGLEFHHQASFMKAGLYYSDWLTTVSPTYAHEIQTQQFGYGMEGLLSDRAGSLTGILNGADYSIWSPEEDSHIPHPYSAADLAPKALNKAALQRELGLFPQPEAPLFIVISRLTYQKGADLLLTAMPTLFSQGAQLAVLGTGDRGLEEAFRRLAEHHPSQVSVTVGYSEALAHRLQAGGDLLMMPSRYEPCGLTQIYALRYGTVPMVSRTGGLVDTVTDTTHETLLHGTATGFQFDASNVASLQSSVDRAISLYRQPDQWARIQANGIARNFNWRESAQQYEKLYQKLLK